MKTIHRTALAALMLGITIGCAGEEDAAPPANPAPLPGSGVKPPGPPPAVPSEPGKGAASKSKEMTPPPPADAKKPGAEGPKMEGPKAGKAEAPAEKLSDEELAEIKKLPAAEQDAAIKQAVCPVSGEHLGSMEKPVKVTADGRTFYLCCGNCEKEVKANPKGVIAKLDKK
jgi:YHS domain-containing protein